MITFGFVLAFYAAWMLGIGYLVREIYLGLKAGLNFGKDD